MSHRLYFAYGSNMDLGQMRVRCPASEVVGCGRLSGHAFRIAAGGYGTVVPDPDSTVHGVLWRLTEADEAELDRYEDLAAGLYRKIDVDIVRDDGSAERTMIYVATHSALGRPVPGYQEQVIEAAAHHRFPTSYIESLRTWLPAGRGWS